MKGRYIGIIVVGFLVVVLLFGAGGWNYVADGWNHISSQFGQKPTPPVEIPPVNITRLRIVGIDPAGKDDEKLTSFTLKNGNYAYIKFDLKHNDALAHDVTVSFELTAEEKRHLSIVTELGKTLDVSNTTFHYNKHIDATDDYIPQQVKAWAHAKVTEITIKVRVHVSVDGNPVGSKQTLTFKITE